MNQRILSHFQLENDGKYFELSFVPGTVNYQDLHAGLTAFAEELNKLEVLQKEHEAKLAAEKAEADKPACEEPCEVVIEPEVVA